MISLKKGLTLRYVEAFTVQFTNSDWLWDRKMFQLYWKYLNYPPYIFSIAHPGFFLLGFASPDCATYEPPKAQTSKKFIKTLRSVWVAGRRCKSPHLKNIKAHEKTEHICTAGEFQTTHRQFKYEKPTKNYDFFMIRVFLFLGQTDIDCGDQEFQAEAKQLPPATSVPRPLGEHQQHYSIQTLICIIMLMMLD